jgi:hypothetical protein
MKRLFALTALVASLFLVSCSKSETANDTTSNSTRVTNGNWKITQYTDSGKDETSDFTSVNFTFNTDGTIVVDNGTANYSGTWIIAAPIAGSDDTGYDDKLNRFTISISGDKLMDKVSKKWLVEKITETEIWLRDDNPTSLEYLRFGK